jgi:benzoylformate decarboxylase
MSTSSRDGNAIGGSHAFLSLLRDEGVGHLFGNPGTTELPIMDAVPDFPELTYVLGLQESLVVAMADGYARASGRLAACNVHVAPGLGNAMGSLYNAKWYGSPMILTAGQQEQGHGLTEPLLYDPLLPMAGPLVKWAVEVTRLEDLPRIVRRAAKVATTPPTGPVFISLPGDILNARDAIDLGAPTRVDTAVRPSDDALRELAKRLVSAQRPVILAGHELAFGEHCESAFEGAAALARSLGAPVYQQTVPYAAHFPSEHPAFMGALTRDQAKVRETLAPYDLVLCLGADVLRMSVWSPVDPLPDGMPVVQIGQRDWEMGKNYPAEMALRADLGETLRALLPVLAEVGGAALARRAAVGLEALAGDNWSARRERARSAADAKVDARPMDPDLAMLRVVDALPEGAVVVEEGLLSARALNALRPFRSPRDFYGLASGGIGFALPGAIGIQLARPERPVLAIVGDGSAMYSIQALWTAAHLKLPITYLICNNRSYRIIKERLLSFHGNDRFVGMDFRDPPLDFVGLARSMGMPAQRIEDPADLGPAVRAAVAGGGPSLLDVMMADGFGA